MCRRVLWQGHKIQMKVDKSATDKVLEANRKALLSALNASYD